MLWGVSVVATEGSPAQLDTEGSRVGIYSGGITQSTAQIKKTLSWGVSVVVTQQSSELPSGVRIPYALP